MFYLWFCFFKRETNFAKIDFSGDVTPSRPGSVLSQYSVTSASTPRLRSTPRRPRPFSIHVTGVSKEKLSEYSAKTD